MLSIENLTYRIGGRALFDGASAMLPTGARVALVGRNGSGKSTLLRLISGELHADGGEIRRPGRMSMGMVAQEAPAGEAGPLEAVLAADTERAQLMAEAETAGDPVRIAEIQTRLADIQAHAAPARAASVLAGLGFDEAAQHRPLSSFSGGWRMRVALAAQLFRQPDLLLLDEPTNHLDLEAALWLTDFLAHYPATLILVSHDRDFLDRVAERILHLEAGKLTLYPGNFARFVHVRAERLAHQSALARRQEGERKRIQAFIDRFRAKASKARQAQSRVKLLARMEPIPIAPNEEDVPEFGFPEPAELAPPLITMDGAAVGYEPGRPILRRLDLRLDPDDRIALIGANGNGKSTFARLIAGRLPAQEGRMTRSPRLAVGYFAQHQLEELRPEWNAYQHLEKLMPNAPGDRVRARLGRFGFSQTRADVKVASLSGGEKARLTLCLISFDAPQVLVLDEPTNHLDMESREALVAALNDYPGAVILVSHDRHLVELIADRLWLVADGTVKPFDGDLDDYERLVLEQSRGMRREARAERTPREQKSEAKAEAKSGDRPAIDKQDRRRAAAEQRVRLAPLKDAQRAAEKRFEKLSRELAEVERALADPALYQDHPIAAQTLMRKQGTLRQTVAEAEAAWLDAALKVEEAEAAGAA
jgi:ATP-binding cassette subfamily F protein 3